MLIDFHTHSKYSVDCLTEPKELAAKAKKLGIVIALTDHNTIAGHKEFRKLGCRFIPGEEVKTDAGDLVGLYLNEEIPKDTEFAETMDRIHSQGGLAYIPHMFDRTRHGVGRHPYAHKADIVEVFNARCLLHGFNKKAEDFAQENGLLKAAGSDSHTIWEFGSTFTEVPDFDLGSPKEMLKALKKAKIHARRAPFYARGMADLTKLWKKISGKR